MTAQELAQKIIEMAQVALEQEKHNVVFIGDTCEAQMGLESILTLCLEVTSGQAAQEAYKQYEKKGVSRAKTSKS